MTFERVYTVDNFYDRPREGIADYRGRPHRYDAEWSAETDDYLETFTLTPLTGETFALAIEQWSIWRQWESAFHRDEVLLETHPGIANQPPRYAELAGILTNHFSAQHPTGRARGLFKVAQRQSEVPLGVMKELVVEWTDV